MNVRAASAVLSGLLGVLVPLASPVGAEEGETRRFTWRPSLVVRSVADDNVRQRDRGKEGDFWMSASPRLELGYEARAFDVGADLGADFRHFADNDDLNDAFYRVKVHAEAGILPGLSARVSDTYVPQSETLGLPEDDASNQQQTNLVDGEIRYWRALDERREFTLGVRGARFDSETFTALVPGPGDTTFVDRSFRGDYWEGGSFLELTQTLGRRSAVYLKGQARYRSFDEAGFSDHTAYLAQLGLRTKWSSRLRMELAGGWGLVDFRSREDVPRFLGSAKLEYRAGSGCTFDLGAHQRFTSDLTGAEFVDTTGRIGVEKYFGRRTAAEITGFLSYLDSESTSPGTNVFGGVELRVRRQLSRRLQLGVAYRYWHNAGAYALDDFAQNRVMLTLGYRY